MSIYSKIGVVGFTLTLLIALFYIYYNPLSTFEGIEWDNHPLETKEYIDELILIQQTKNAKAQKELDESVKAWKILKEIQDEILESHWLQVRTIVLDDVVEIEQNVEVSEPRFIPWGKVIPSAIVGNTKAKRFHNFVAHFARWFDSSVFVEARNRYWIKEEVLACIAWADSDMGNANKSTNNIMNYGNNDRWQTRAYDSVLSSVMSAAHWLSEWKYLSRNQWIWELSQWGRTYIGVQWCAEAWQYCYATSPINWRRNVNNCLTFIEWEKKSWDTLSFKNNNGK